MGSLEKIVEIIGQVVECFCYLGKLALIILSRLNVYKKNSYQLRISFS